MLILVLDTPLDDTLIGNTCREHGAIFKNFDRLDHAGVTTEASTCGHFILAEEVIPKINDFKFFNCQRGESEQIKTSLVASHNCIVQKTESGYLRHKALLSEQ
jgi:hypothetical protein